MPITVSQPLESFYAGKLKEDDAKLNKYGLHKMRLLDLKARMDLS